MDYSVARISHEDRDRASALLGASLADGRLDQAEFERRIESVYGATTTYGELWQVVFDLPGAEDLMPRSPAPVLPVPPVMMYPVPRNTNGFAVASLVSSLVGFPTLGFGFVLGVVFGHVARAQIRETSDGGAGLSTAGLVIGYLGVAGGVALLGAVMVLAVVG